MNEPQIVLYLGNGDWHEAAFNVGDVVLWNTESGPQIVAGVTIYPMMDYVFAYWLKPLPGSQTIGHDVPEDELVLA